MRVALLALLSICTFSATVSAQAGDPYCGCLLIVDDVRKPDQLAQVKGFPTNHLLRSWYRFGKPPLEKQYAQRTNILQQLRTAGITVGGGTSLSVVNDRDIASKDFDADWLSVDLIGTPVRAPGRQYATLSAPGFRSYLIRNLVEQAQLGITELHLGESNGEIRFDDWTLGLQGEAGFIQWVRKKYKDKPDIWWQKYLGSLGAAIFNETVSRKDFIELPKVYEENLMLEWGKPDSWEGKNRNNEPAFLAFLYRQNLLSFLSELRAALQANNLTDVKVDVWGFADWMKDLSPRPDAFISSPPDERWGLNWSTDADFSLAKNAARLRSIMTQQIQSLAPSPVIYMVDHPRQFQGFVKLPDKQQALLIAFFSQLTKELGANFAFRADLENAKNGESKAVAVTQTECKKRVQFCPGRLPKVGGGLKVRFESSAHPGPILPSIHSSLRRNFTMFAI